MFWLRNKKIGFQSGGLILSSKCLDLICLGTEGTSTQEASKVVSNSRKSFNFRFKKQNNRVKPVLSSHSKGRPKLFFKTDYRLMQVKSIAECSKRAFCNTFNLHLATIKLPFVFKIFVLSIFEWPL